MNDLTRRDFVIPVERYDPETRTVSGIISSGALDHWGDQIDQDGIRVRSSVPLLWHHDSRQPIGRSLSIQRNGDKTHASFRLATAGVDPTADRIHALAKDGVISSLSVGLLPKRWEGNVLRESELLEVSLVSLGANPDATISTVRAAPQQETIVMEHGMARVAPAPGRVASPAVITREAGADRWSFGRALAMIIGDRDANLDWGFELETHQELLRRGASARHGGIMVPLRGMLERAIGTVPPTDAGVALTSVAYMDQLFGLDASAVTPAVLMGRLGARVVISDQPNVAIPRQDVGLGDMIWISRDGNAVEQSDAHFRSIDLQPKTGTTMHVLKRSARLYGVPSIMDLYRSQMVEKIAFGVDLATLYGDGTGNNPAGLITETGLQKPTMTTLDYPGLAAMAASVLTLPVEPANRAWLFNPALQLALMSTHKMGTGAKSDETIIGENQNSLLGVRFETASQVAVDDTTGTTDVWLGDWGLIIQCWFSSGAIEILPNPYATDVYASGGIKLISFVDFNCACLDAKRFAVTQGVVTPIKPTPLGASGTRASKAAEHGSGRK